MAVWEITPSNSANLAMIRIFMAITAGALALAGCNRQQASSIPDLGGPGGTITWSASGESQKPVTGIDEASVFYVGRTFVVWAAFDGGAGGNWSGNMHGVKGEGRVWSREHGQVEFRFETKDGRSGAVTINETEYDLKDGGLFLVSANADQYQIKQLKRDMKDVKFNRESLAAFARNDAEILAFFARTE
jgi:hypothetical protein